MKKPFRRRGLRATLTVAGLGTATLLVTSAVAFAAPHTSSSATTRSCVSKAQTGPRMGRIGGIVNARATPRCQSVNKPASGAAGDTANGTPPLIWHGGPVMGTTSTGPVVVTPIFWNPAGHPIPTAYKKIIDTYLHDVALASS